MQVDVDEDYDDNGHLLIIDTGGQRANEIIQMMVMVPMICYMLEMLWLHHRRIESKWNNANDDKDLFCVGNVVTDAVQRIKG